MVGGRWVAWVAGGWPDQTACRAVLELGGYPCVTRPQSLCAGGAFTLNHGYPVAVFSARPFPAWCQMGLVSLRKLPDALAAVTAHWGLRTLAVPAEGEQGKPLALSSHFAVSCKASRQRKLVGLTAAD